jgi:hypothetical protein
MDEFFVLTFAFFCFMSYIIYSIYQLVERLVVQLEMEIQKPRKRIKKMPPPPPPLSEFKGMSISEFKDMNLSKYEIEDF